MVMGVKGHAAAAVLLAISLQACTKADLAFRPEKGQSKTYHVESTAKNHMKMNMSGEGGMNMNQDVNQEQTRTFDITYEVTEVQPQAVTMEATYCDISTSNKGGEGNEVLEIPAQLDAMNTKLESILEGKSFTVKIGPKGAVLDVSGLTELTQEVRQAVTESTAAMFEGLPGNLSGPITEMAITNAAGGLAHPDQVRQWLENIFAYFPPQETRVGSSWSDTDHVPGEFPMQIARKYRLSSVDGNHADVRFTSDAKADKQGGSAMPFLDQINMAGTGSGNAKLDKNSGWPVEVDEELNLSGDLKMNQEQGMPMPIDVNMTIDVDTRMKITQKQ
jgi:hypothetical protein